MSNLIAVVEPVVGVIAAVLPYVAFLIGFSIVIFFHELGHFLAAKFVGIRVDRFAVGFGYRLVGYRRGEGLTFGPMKTYPEGQGPARLGETDYCLNALPIGGYVKMFGQIDLEEDDNPDKPKAPPHPRSFDGKTVGQRMLVISAGVIMNLLFSLVVFTGIYWHGVDISPPVVGRVKPGSPADKAGFQAGDRILQVNNEKLEAFEDLIFAVILSDSDDPSTFVVRRGDQTRELVGRAERPAPDAPFRQMGVEQASRPVLVTDDALATPPGEAPLLKGDRVVAVTYTDAQSGQRVERPVTHYWEVFDAFALAQGGPVALTVERTGPDGQPTRVTTARRPIMALMPYINLAQKPVTPNWSCLLGLQPRVTVTLNEMKDSPARQAGFKSGDVVLKVGPHENPTYQKIVDYLKAHNGDEVTFTVLRDAREKLDLKIVARVSLGQAPIVGMGWDLASAVDTVGPPVVANVLPEWPAAMGGGGTGATQSAPVSTVAASQPASRLVPTPAAEAGLPAGCTILAVDDQKVASWVEVFQAFWRRASVDGPRSVQVTYQTAGGETRTATMALPRLQPRPTGTVPLDQATEPGWNMRVYFFYPVDFERVTELQRRANPLDAMGLAVFKTYQNVQRQYEIMKKMAKMEISVNEVRSPIGIIHEGGQAVQAGWMPTIMFLGLLSLGLAVFNFLPIPLLDGGHMVFLIYEKIRGRPAPINVRIWLTLISLVIIIGCLFYGFFNDIRRLIFG